MKMKITGTGSALPREQVSNIKMMEWVETSDEWIKERTGIANRHLSTGETVASLAADACKKALEMAGVEATEVDAILLATCSPEWLLPCAACQVQDMIGAQNAVAFDINAACSGFLFGLTTAQAYIASGMYKKILVVGSEVLSKIMNWEDRTSCILFGDGAGAMVVTATEGPGEMVMHSEGAKGEALECETGAKLSMDGQKVFKFAVKSVPMAITELLGKLRMSKNDIDWYILHQANMRIIESVSKRLDISMDKIPCNIAKMGNTSSASVGILLDEARKNGKIKNGDKIIISGFGAGLTWGAGYIIG